MALSDNTYSGLKSSIAEWLARSDLTTAQVEDIILMFEKEANRNLRVRQMETSTSLTPASGEASLPSDFLAVRSLTWEGSTTAQLEYVHPDWLRAKYPSAEDGTPAVFTIEGSTLSIRPTSTTSLTLRYWQKIPALEDQGDAGTNWLLTAHPDVYLAGCLYRAQKFLQNAQGALYWKEIMEEGFGEIKKLSEKSKAPVAARVMGATP
jgi:hypothetical protein